MKCAWCHLSSSNHPIKSDCTIIYSLIDGVAICSCALDYNYLPFQAWSFFVFPCYLVIWILTRHCQSHFPSKWLLSAHPHSRCHCCMKITIFWALKHVLCISINKSLSIFYWRRLPHLRIQEGRASSLLNAMSSLTPSVLLVHRAPSRDLHLECAYMILWDALSPVYKSADFREWWAHIKQEHPSMCMCVDLSWFVDLGNSHRRVSKMFVNIWCQALWFISYSAGTDPKYIAHWLLINYVSLISQWNSLIYILFKAHELISFSL